MESNSIDTFYKDIRALQIKLNNFAEVISTQQKEKNYHQVKFAAAKEIYQSIISFDKAGIEFFLTYIKAKRNKMLGNLLIITLLCIDTIDPSQDEIRERIQYLDILIDITQVDPVKEDLYDSVGTILELSIESYSLELIKFLIGHERFKLEDAFTYALKYTESIIVNRSLNPEEISLNRERRNRSIKVLEYLAKEMLLLNSSKVDTFNLLDTLNTSSIKEVKHLSKDLLKTNLHSNNYRRIELLHYFAWSSNREQVKLLLDRISHVNIQDFSSNTPLHYASLAEEVEMIKLLVDLGADINVKNYDQNTPLHIAALYKKVKSVKMLLSLGARIDSTNCKRHTALHCAAAVGNQQIVSMLLNLGSDVNARNGKGETPLHYAMSNGEDVAKILLDYKAEINAANYNGETSLHYATKANHELIQLLAQYGIKLDQRNNEGETPLHYAAMEDNLHAVQELLSFGADYGIINWVGDTALHYAVRYQAISTILELKNAGADLEKKNYAGNTPLYYAVENSDIATMEILVDLGANFNTQNNIGNTLLHYCASRNNKMIAKALISYGADINLRNIYKDHPFSKKKEMFDEIVMEFITDGSGIFQKNLLTRLIKAYEYLLTLPEANHNIVYHSLKALQKEEKTSNQAKQTDVRKESYIKDEETWPTISNLKISPSTEKIRSKNDTSKYYTR